eukprot:3131196-Rhodomonas_salina.5
MPTPIFEPVLTSLSSESESNAQNSRQPASIHSRTFNVNILHCVREDELESASQALEGGEWSANEEGPSCSTEIWRERGAEGKGMQEKQNLVVVAVERAERRGRGVCGGCANETRTKVCQGSVLAPVLPCFSLPLLLFPAALLTSLSPRPSPLAQSGEMFDLCLLLNDPPLCTSLLSLRTRAAPSHVQDTHPSPHPSSASAALARQQLANQSMMQLLWCPQLGSNPRAEEPDNEVGNVQEGRESGK